MNPTDPLAELRGLSLPEPPLFDWWPLSIAGWIVLIALIVAVYVLARFVKQQTADNWYKQAQLELQTIRKLFQAGDIDQQDLHIRCSALCRRVAMAVQGREAIASLTGTAWLQKLDELSSSHDFTQGCGALLDDRMWERKSEQSQYSTTEVLDGVSRLIRHNKPNLKFSMGLL